MRLWLLIVLGLVAACGPEAVLKQDTTESDAVCCEISERPSCGCFSLGGSVANGCGGTLCDAPPLGWERVIDTNGCPMWVCGFGEPCGAGSCLPWSRDTGSPPDTSEDIAPEVADDAGPDSQVDVAADASPTEDDAPDIADIGSDDAKPAAPCTTTRDCALDQVCRDGHCGADACSSPSDCPRDHGCPVAGPGPAPRVCAASCDTDDECRPGESCKQFIEGRYCGRSGNDGSGSACADFAACRDELVCLPWAGGYCALAGCADNADCESGTWCIAETEGEVCAQGCVSTPCRESEGYLCVLSPTLGGIDRFVCVP